MDEIKDNKRKLTDAELIDLIAEQNKIRTKGIVLLAVAIACIIAAVIAGMVSAVPVCIIAVVLAIVFLLPGCARLNQSGGAIKQLLTSQLLPPIMDSFFESWEHHPFARLPDSIVRHVPMGIDDFHEVEGSDHIQAVYRGLNLEMSDICLTKVEEKLVEHTDDDGNVTIETEKERTVVFNGQWIVIDFAKEIAADLLLAERERAGRTTDNSVNTENTAFNGKFRIITKDAHTAFYILTPHMMEYILRMDEKGKGRTYIPLYP